MKYMIAMLMLCFGLTAQAQECTATIWTATNLSYCVAHHWGWDDQQRIEFEQRLVSGQVEIDISEVVNARCDMQMTVFDPVHTDKQQYFECLESMTPQS